MDRTISRDRVLLVALAAILAVVTVAAPARSAEPTFTPVKRYSVVRTMVFPVLGIAKYRASFGDCRDNCTREHHGVDIFTYGWKGVPVVAAHDGVVTRITYNDGNAGCSIRIRSRDRWETRYLHLNNDSPGTDEVGFPCVAPGIEVGATVKAGQIIAWIGDSGNSEDGAPHIHFELRNRSGYPIDPYRSLQRSRKVLYEWLPSDSVRTSIILSQANHADGAAIVFVVSRDDFRTLEGSEVAASVFQAPIVVFNPADPQRAFEEILRLSPDRVVVFSDTDVSWLLDRLMSSARIVERASLPVTRTAPLVFTPDSEVVPAIESNTPDRFATIISGRVDRIRRSHRDAYANFIMDHRSLVLVHDRWANRDLGERSRSLPDKYADDSLLWWPSGTGWIGTGILDDPPDRGIAYLTERRATPWTLAFLSSLTESPPVPVWKNSG